MLPEILSNDLCSLNPLEDKYTFTALFEIDKKTAEIKKRWFGKTVINSNKRFTYEEAQEIISKGEGLFAKELGTLNNIAKILQKQKFANGAIDFDQEEVKFKLDENGSPLEVYKKERLDAHKLVEEYMLLANREVAKIIFDATKHKKGLVGLYRIHNEPDQEKIQNLALFLKALGHSLPVIKGKIDSKDINILLKKIEGSAAEALIKTATIRSMAKAVYSPTNSGHFGLAFTYYTHFTSPIRRYPDLIVHRILETHLKDTKITKDEFAKIHKIAELCSEKEVRASEAERASIKMKQVEYMSTRIGQVFDGSISGVTEWGIYVEEINTKCEGMIRLKDIKGDYFTLDQKNYRIIGDKTKKAYSLGDKVKFKVLRADIERKTLDFGLVN
jgi:ribonuclease R